MLMQNSVNCHIEPHYITWKVSELTLSCSLVIFLGKVQMMPISSHHDSFQGTIQGAVVNLVGNAPTSPNTHAVVSEQCVLYTTGC